MNHMRAASSGKAAESTASLRLGAVWGSVLCRHNRPAQKEYCPLWIGPFTRVQPGSLGHLKSRQSLLECGTTSHGGVD